MEVVVLEPRKTSSYFDLTHSGFILMVDAFSKSQMILGILLAISTFIWISVAIYNIAYFFQARREFSSLGGAKAASKDFARQGVQGSHSSLISFTRAS